MRRSANPVALANVISGLMVSAVLLAVEPTLAADISLQVPPPMPVYNWTGFYIGAHGGGGWDRAAWIEDGLASSPGFGVAIPGSLDGTVNASGVLGGVQGGFNYQVGSIVFGIEADGSGAHVTGSTTCFTQLAAAAACSTSINAVGTLSARIGTSYNNLLLYILGGGARWSEKLQTLAGTPGTATLSTTPLGWTIGVGVEYAMPAGWSAFVQYNYIDFFDPRDLAFSSTQPPGFFTENIRENLSLLKIGVNYRFGWVPGLPR